MLTLLLTRHGHTTRSEPEQYLGQHVDAPLSERGRADARLLAGRLAGVAIDRIISSPLPRAADTAAILAGDGSYETDDRLMEIDYGAWEGLTVDQIESRFPAERERYEADPSSFRIGGGESGSQVAERVRRFIGDLLAWSGNAGQDGRTVVVVGHSSLNRIMLAVLLDTPLRDYRRRFQQDWASLTVLRWRTPDAGPLLLLANDVAHIRGSRGVTWQ